MQRLFRSTKAGAAAPATPAAAPISGTMLISAQRRPGPQPRRHDIGPHESADASFRSTKAGAAAPATLSASPNAWPISSVAQRRPGPQPRRHATAPVATKDADDFAQRRPGPQPRRHTDSCWPTTCSGPSLNEGRGRSPGDTFRPRIQRAVTFNRSTKAGAAAPATPVRFRPCAGHALERSTKAGAAAPATRWWRAPRCTRVGALNEGRGRSPGDTCGPRASRPARCPLNEGRGRSPGDTCRAAASGERRSPLNEGRGRSPGDTVSGLKRFSVRYIAQRRPGPQPRRHPSFFSTNDSSLLSAQRRPGPQPRRHPYTSRSALSRSTALNEGRGRSPGDTRPNQR